MSQIYTNQFTDQSLQKRQICQYAYKNDVSYPFRQVQPDDLAME